MPHIGSCLGLRLGRVFGLLHSCGQRLLQVLLCHWSHRFPQLLPLLLLIVIMPGLLLSTRHGVVAFCRLLAQVLKLPLHPLPQS